MTKDSSVIQDEIEKFDQLSNDWWKYKGSFGALHHINPIRIQYITDKIYKQFGSTTNQIRLLDAGCGGGIASMPFARQGMQVTGIDASEQAIKAAQSFATHKNVSAKFIHESIEAHAQNGNQYDTIICLEMLEHTDNPAWVIQNLVSMLKQDGIIFLSTINRTRKAKLFAIYLAENVLGLVPEHTHEYKKFIKPLELEAILAKENLLIKEFKGISFNLLHQQWELSDNLSINYIAYFANHAPILF